MIRIIQGDCLAVMDKLNRGGVSVDSVVTDPPYNMASVVKRFGSKTAAPAKAKQTGAYARHSTNHIGQTWDGDIAFQRDVWRLTWGLLKPGGHMLVFGGTRTYHKLATAIESAGFEIRDQVGWMYGTGFPKSHQVKEKGWTDWGTALKPAWEPIVLARKPLAEKTVAKNVAQYGTGAINVGGCVIEGASACDPRRWPANVIHDGSPDAHAALGHASRFFYHPKADASDRAGSRHPTVKPVALIAYLCRLITPPGGTVLDMFAGSGTLLPACLREGFKPLMIERNPEYVEDIRRRKRAKK